MWYNILKQEYPLHQALFCLNMGFRSFDGGYEMGTGNLTFKKKKNLPKWFPAAVCIAAAALIAAAAIIALSIRHNKEEQKNRVGGGTWSTAGFENISEIKNANGLFNVFTDSQTGKMGIMRLNGEVTEKAENSAFAVYSDEWRNYRYTVESPLSEYLLLVDKETLTITTRQYHGVQVPEKIPCWNETAKHLAWTDSIGYAGEVKKSELNLAQGLFPVATALGDGAKYGYISRNLVLEIAAVYERAEDFSEGKAAVKRDGKWGYINENGVTEIAFEYESAPECDLMEQDRGFSFTNGLAPAKKGGLFGIINNKGETVVDFVFEIILPGEGGVYTAKKNGAWGILTVDKESVEAASALVVQTTTEPDGSELSLGTYMVVTSGSVLNIRSASEPDASIVGKLPNGSVVEVSMSVPGWAYITYKSTKGWVSSDFLKPYVVSTTQAQTSQSTVPESQSQTNQSASV